VFVFAVIAAKREEDARGDGCDVFGFVVGRQTSFSPTVSATATIRVRRVRQARHVSAKQDVRRKSLEFMQMIDVGGGMGW
jgi:hypothetical protein